jgi:hypothetical protein
MFSVGVSAVQIIFLLLSLGFLVFTFYIQPKLIKLDNPGGTTTCEISERSLTIDNENGRITSMWDIFCEMRETKQHYILFLAENPQGFVLIPKRAFETRSRNETFLRITSQNISQRKYPYLLRYWYLFLMYIAYVIITIFIINQLG